MGELKSRRVLQGVNYAVSGAVLIAIVYGWITFGTTSGSYMIPVFFALPTLLALLLFFQKGHALYLSSLTHQKYNQESEALYKELMECQRHQRVLAKSATNICTTCLDKQEKTVPDAMLSDTGICSHCMAGGEVFDLELLQFYEYSGITDPQEIYIHLPRLRVTGLEYGPLFIDDVSFAKHRELTGLSLVDIAKKVDDYKSRTHENNANKAS